MPNTDALSILNPSIVGQAEKAHAAILKKLLTGTTLDEHQWITLQVALASGEQIDPHGLIDQVSKAAKYSPAEVELAINALVEASLMKPAADEPNLDVTLEGRELVETLRAQIAQYVGGAYDSVPAEDLATTARVLTSITADLSEQLLLVTIYESPSNPH
jgi:hypothetical protein